MIEVLKRLRDFSALWVRSPKMRIHCTLKTDRSMRAFIVLPMVPLIGIPISFKALPMVPLVIPLVTNGTIGKDRWY